MILPVVRVSTGDDCFSRPLFRENLERIIVERIARVQHACTRAHVYIRASVRVFCQRVYKRPRTRVRVRVSAVALARTRHTEREERKGPPEGEGVRVRQIES